VKYPDDEEVEICECEHTFSDHDVLDRCTLEGCECIGYLPMYPEEDYEPNEHEDYPETD
jgi:hypothetical protein